MSPHVSFVTTIQLPQGHTIIVILWTTESPLFLHLFMVVVSIGCKTYFVVVLVRYYVLCDYYYITLLNCILWILSWWWIRVLVIFAAECWIILNMYTHCWIVLLICWKMILSTLSLFTMLFRVYSVEFFSLYYWSSVDFVELPLLFFWFVNQLELRWKIKFNSPQA